MKKKTSTKKTATGGDISETDFSKGVRGKYAATLKENGYTIRVHRSNGTFEEKLVLGESLVSLDPDVRAYFPDSRAVNRALRKIISTEHQTSPKRLHGGRRSA
jgi:hypothetical protein